MPNNDAILNAIILVCVFGILLSALMIIFKDYIVKPDYFTELYFNEPAELPRHLEINKSYNFSFSIVNREKVARNYLYYLRSDVKNITSKVKLLPGESATFNVDVRPEGLLWRVNSSIDYRLSSSFDAVHGFFGLPSTISLDSNLSYYPLSFNLTGFGEVYHVNLSVDTLKESPFHWSTESYQMGNDSRLYHNLNVTFYSEGDKILVNSSRIEESSVIMPDRFAVMLYGKGNLIYFNYGVGY